VPWTRTQYSTPNFADESRTQAQGETETEMAQSLEAKIVVLGAQGVGKTSLVHRFAGRAEMRDVWLTTRV